MDRITPVIQYTKVPEIEIFGMYLTHITLKVCHGQTLALIQDATGQI